MITTAIILAAGRGSRLDPDGSQHDFSKPLLKLGDASLLERSIASCRAAGIKRVLVVTGFHASAVDAEVERINDGDIKSVHNPDWRKSNGLSLLVCQEHVQESFVLMMCDHVFDASILADLTTLELRSGSVSLAVDYKIDTIFDMEDATKVEITEGAITGISKTLSQFQAIDCGLFACSTAIFDALARAAKATGDCSLSEGMADIARQGGFFPFDIGARWWQDVDTPEMLEEALCRLEQKTPA